MSIKIPCPAQRPFNFAKMPHLCSKKATTMQLAVIRTMAIVIMGVTKVLVWTSFVRESSVVTEDVFETVRVEDLRTAKQLLTRSSHSQKNDTFHVNFQMTAMTTPKSCTQNKQTIENTMSSRSRETFLKFPCAASEQLK